MPKDLLQWTLRTQAGWTSDARLLFWPELTAELNEQRGHNRLNLNSQRLLRKSVPTSSILLHWDQNLET